MIINFNNIGSVTGDGGGTPSPSPSNYRVVDALSAITNPTEGLMAYVKAKTKVTNGIRFEISDWNAFPKEADGKANGHLAVIQDEDWDESTQAPNKNSICPITLIGNQFPHFKNDGNLHSFNTSHNGNTYIFGYKTYNGEESGYGSYFDLYMIDKPCKLWLNNGCSTAVTTTPYVEITPGQTYLYSAGQWVEIAPTTFVWEDIAPSTTAETAALLEEIRASVARGIYPSIFYEKHFLTYTYSNQNYVAFEGIRYSNEYVDLRISDKIFNNNGFDSNGIFFTRYQFVGVDRYQHGIEMTSAGTFTNPDTLGKFSEENHMDEIIFRINKDNGDWSQAPLKYVWRKYEEINGETKLVYYWAVEIIVDGVLYKGAWHAIEWDWGNYVTDTWAAVS